VLADLVEAIASRCAVPPIAGRSKDAYQRAWLDLAKTRDPVAVGALVAGLLRSVPERKLNYFTAARDVKRYQPMLERIAALAGCGDDPRIASALVEVLAKAPMKADDVASAHRVYGSTLDLLSRIADERSAARLRALLERPIAKTATMRQFLAGVLPTVIRAIEQKLGKRRRLSDAERKAAEQRIAELGVKKPDVHVVVKSADLDALIADCLATPADDGPRMVLADALLEREDPRGEFIQLQLRDARRELGEPERKRMQSLQRKHEKEWLADITRVTKLRVFRRGFLDEAELLQGAAADPATWQRVVRDPRLATIRTLYKGSASEELYTTFVESPATKQLAEIEVTSTAALSELTRPLAYIMLHSGLTKEALVMLPAIAKRTGAKRLAFETKLSPSEVLAQLQAWPGTKCFDELAVIWSYRNSEAWTKQRKLWLGALDKLVPRLGYGAGRDRTILQRGKRGLVAEVHATQEWSVLYLAKTVKLEKLVVRGVPAPWFKPTAAFGKAIAKIATVELYDGWRPYA
jgi:uncharacterized protein (TIGR02996 family)